LSEAQNEKKAKKPGRWNLVDALIGIFALAAIIAMTVAAFLAAKWIKTQYF